MYNYWYFEGHADGNSCNNNIEGPSIPKILDQQGWTLVKNILVKGKVDLILTVMTYALARNHSIALKNPEGKIAETVTDFFGDIHWKKLDDSKELMNYYLSKIQSLGYKVFTIKVHRIGQSKLYDIILATKNENVSKIFGDLTMKMDQVNPALLKAAIGSNQKESIELDNYFEMRV